MVLKSNFVVTFVATSKWHLTGYAKNSVYRVLSRFRKNADYRSKVNQVGDFFPELYLMRKKMETLRYDHIDNLALTAYESDPQAILKHPQILKQLKMSARLLPSDNESPAQQVVNIDSIQLLVKQSYQNSEKVMDAEVIGPAQIGTGERKDS